MIKRKGHPAWNKGLKTGLVPKTAFKKGFIPWNKGKKHTAESCAKISKAKLGKKQSLETCQKRSLALKLSGHTPPALRGSAHYYWKGGIPKCVDCGKKLSTYGVKRCKACSGKRNGGKNHYNWKGGITKQRNTDYQKIEYRLWRESVFSRDNWTCRCCGVKGGPLNAHHIKPYCAYPDLRTSISNGLTLCVVCHRKIHSENRSQSDARRA